MMIADGNFKLFGFCSVYLNIYLVISQFKAQLNVFGKATEKGERICQYMLIIKCNYLNNFSMAGGQFQLFYFI